MSHVETSNFDKSIEQLQRSSNMEGEKGVPRSPVVESAGSSTQEKAVTLIPRPSDDPRDPLNWPMSKKVGLTGVLCLAVFAGFTAPLAGQLNVKSQSVLYKQSTTHIAWQVSHLAHSQMFVLILCLRTLQHQQVSQLEDSSLRPCPSSSVEALPFFGH